MRWPVLIPPAAGMLVIALALPLHPRDVPPTDLGSLARRSKWPGYGRISTRSMPNCALPKRGN